MSNSPEVAGTMSVHRVVYNYIKNPTKERLAEIEASEYAN